MEEHSVLESGIRDSEGGDRRFRILHLSGDLSPAGVVEMFLENSPLLSEMNDFDMYENLRILESYPPPAAP